MSFLRQLLLIQIMSIIMISSISANTPQNPVSLYDDTELTLLQTFNGEGFLSQGGCDRVNLMVKNIELENKTILDFGTGLGGPAFHLVQKHNTIVTGVDIDSSLVKKATQRAQDQGITSNISFTTIHNNSSLPFNDTHFDIIFSKESIIHIKNKPELFKEFHRVLKPGGTLVMLDWFWQGLPPSQDFLQCWNFDSYGTAMHFATLREYISLLQQEGFIDIESNDTSSLHLNDMRNESVLLHGIKGQEILQMFGSQFLEGCIATWSRLTRMFESGEIATYLIQAKKQ